MILIIKNKTKLSIESSPSFIEELQLILKAIQYSEKDSQFIYAENDGHIEYILNNEEVIEIFGELENNVFYTNDGIPIAIKDKNEIKFIGEI